MKIDNNVEMWDRKNRNEISEECGGIHNKE
jgi:hypothetical protein